jgi:protein TonB
VVVSTAFHCLVVLLGLWVGFPVRPSAPERFTIREIDFLGSEAGGGGGGADREGPSVAAERRGSPATPPRASRAEAAIGPPQAIDTPSTRQPQPTPTQVDGTGAEPAERSAPPVPPVLVPGAREAGSGDGARAGSGVGAGAGPGSGPGTGGGRGGGTAGDPDFSRYFGVIKDRVHAAWRYPQGVAGTHKLALTFTVQRDGDVRAIRVVSSTNAALNDSAVRAMERAAPFPPIPETLLRLAGEPLTMLFTVTIE